MKNLYRFKTEIEFEEEFGSDWMYDVFCSFVDDMYYLLGTEIDNSDIKNLLNDDYILIESKYDSNGFAKTAIIDGWEISYQMIKLIKHIKPNYNNVKKLVYE